VATSVKLTILAVGADEPRLEDLVLSLSRDGVLVERLASTNTLAEAVADLKPDLVLAVGEAAEDGGVLVTQNVSAADNPSIPVVVMPRETQLGSRVGAFLNGATAVLSWSRRPEETALALESLVHRVRSLPRGCALELGEATIDDLLKLASDQLHQGLQVGNGLESKSKNAPKSSLEKFAPVKVTLGDGRRVAETVAGFVEQITSLVINAEPAPLASEISLNRDIEGLNPSWNGLSDEIKAFSGLRILLGLSMPGRTDELARALRERGSIVAVTDHQARGLELASDLDPNVVVVDASDFELEEFKLLSTLRAHTRLRWSPVLVIDPSTLLQEGMNLKLSTLARQIQGLTEDDRLFRERASASYHVQVAIETLGPARLLRILADINKSFSVEVRSDKTGVCVDLREGLMIGGVVKDEAHGQVVAEGLSALQAFLELTQGTAHVQVTTVQTHVNIVLPLDQAMAIAMREAPEMPVLEMPAPRVPIKSDVQLRPRMQPRQSHGPSDVTSAGGATSAGGFTSAVKSRTLRLSGASADSALPTELRAESVLLAAQHSAGNRDRITRPLPSLSLPQPIEVEEDAPSLYDLVDAASEPISVYLDTSSAASTSVALEATALATVLQPEPQDSILPVYDVPTRRAAKRGDRKRKATISLSDDSLATSVEEGPFAEGAPSSGVVSKTQRPTPQARERNLRGKVTTLRWGEPVSAATTLDEITKNVRAPKSFEAPAPTEPFIEPTLSTGQEGLADPEVRQSWHTIQQTRRRSWWGLWLALLVCLLLITMAWTLQSIDADSLNKAQEWLQ